MKTLLFGSSATARRAAQGAGAPVLAPSDVAAR